MLMVPWKLNAAAFSRLERPPASVEDFVPVAKFIVVDNVLHYHLGCCQVQEVLTKDLRVDLHIAHDA